MATPQNGLLLVALNFVALGAIACGAVVVDAADDGLGGAASGGPPACGAPNVEDLEIEELAAGDAHTCLRTTAGEVYCWGSNEFGQLGLGSRDDSLCPRQVSLERPAVNVAAGAFHTCALLDHEDPYDEWTPRTVYCWGRNDRGQIGDGSQLDALLPVEIPIPQHPFKPYWTTPQQAFGLGRAHSCVLASNGDVMLYCWGANDSGQLGSVDATTVPALVANDTWVVAAGPSHTCFRDVDLSFYCMGDNSELQCGLEGPSPVTTPVMLAGSWPGVDSVRAGHGDHSCATTESGVHCWGANESGQLGSAPSAPLSYEESQPVDPPWADDVQIGTAHTCSLNNGSMQCWGDNDYGQLGFAGEDVYTPTDVGDWGYTQAIAAGARHTCATSGTEVFCWGDNARGQLGNLSTQASPVPVRVAFP